MRTILLGAAIAAIAIPSTLLAQRDRYSEERAANVSASGASEIRIIARAGTLRIEGRQGGTEVRARGTARASSRDILREIELVAERVGSAVEVRVEIPELGHDGWDDDYAGLDLVVEVPADAALDVQDSSGDTEIRDVGRLRIEDSSGDLRIDGAGAIEVDDSSGDLRIRDARGDVRITDSSGGIEVRTVRGSVTVERDGSGSIEAYDVTGSVRVESDGSGGIDVERVGGDFVVDRARSGGIEHRDVKGEVRIPARRRDR